MANEGLPRWVDELLKLKEEASEELSKGLEASWACRILDHLKIPRPGKEGPLGKIRREAPGDAEGRNYDWS